MFDLPGSFNVDECLTCGVISTHPFLSIKDVNKYYTENYDPFQKAIEDEKSWLLKINRTAGVIKRCKSVLKQSPVKRDGKILDIGCSTGVFLHRMSELGWEGFGVEPSNYAADYARNRFNLSISNSYLTKNLFPNNYFDIITLWDVFEHISDPISSLSLILNYLKPGGLLVITTPNSSSFGRCVWNEYWAGWDTPRHYHVFNGKLLKSLLQRSGFHVIGTRSFTNNFGLLLISLQFYLKEHVPAKFSKIIISIFQSLPFRILTYPYIWFSCLMEKPSSITIFAKKPDTHHVSHK
jgi:2-polyprenyl-3-methyl-5-hydroxy-6-metoxy-1,4-benzoquinol methylase